MSESFYVSDRKSTPFATFGAECLGTFAFVWLSLMNVSTFALYPSNMGWEGIALSWGLNLFVGIKIAQTHANAYVNPCVAIADYLHQQVYPPSDGFVPLKTTLLHVVAEMSGAMLAAIATYGLNYSNWQDPLQCGAFATGRQVAWGSAMGVEFIGTMLLAYVISKTPDGPFKPVCIATTLTTLVLAMGFQTAFSFNTARDMGPRLVATMFNSDCIDWEYSMPLIIANNAGAIVGFFLASAH